MKQPKSVMEVSESVVVLSWFSFGCGLLYFVVLNS